MLVRKNKKKKHRPRQLSLGTEIPTLSRSRAKERHSNRTQRGNVSYPRYWIWIPSEKGVAGSWDSKQDAYNYGNAHIDARFEVHALNTVDKAKASSILKAKRMPKEKIKFSQVVREKVKHFKTQ